MQLKQGRTKFEVTFQGFMDIIGIQIMSNDLLHMDIWPCQLPGPTGEMRMKTSIDEATIIFDAIRLQVDM